MTQASLFETETRSPAFDWLEIQPEGLYCHPGDFYLDPRRAVHRAVVSHAHADHYPRFLGEVIATPATLALGKARYRNTAGKIHRPLPCHKAMQIGSTEVQLVPAGHILGSAQVRIRYNGQTVVYSGDLHLDEAPFCEPFEMPPGKVDLLICESTFGRKAGHAAPEATLRAEVEKAGSKPVMIAVYALGKAQRMQALITAHFPGHTVLVDRGIHRFNQVYAEFGYDPGPYGHYRRKAVRDAGSKLFYLMPPRMLSSYYKDHQWHKLFASGFDRREKYWFLDGWLDISDHASADQIMEMIEKMQPGEVWFCHGNSAPLRESCKTLGIPAYHINL